MTSQRTVAVGGVGGVRLGVFWVAWNHVGFWWALLYGTLWPMWAGAHLAAYLFGGWAR